MPQSGAGAAKAGPGAAASDRASQMSRKSLTGATLWETGLSIK